jgi:CrcB protein
MSGALHDSVRRDRPRRGRGAIARYPLALWIQQRTASLFRFGTFIVNISGCLVMGVTMTLLTEKLAVSTSWRFLVPVRFIGAYTTFSTFEFDTDDTQA